MEVEMKIRGLMMDPVTNMPIVVLKDIQGNAILPIWVGIYEANAIALEIEKVTTPRPMTHDLMKTLLFGLGAGVKKVVVSDLKDDTFYAIIYLTVTRHQSPAGLFTLGVLTFLAASFRQSRDLIQRFLLSLAQLFEQALYLDDLFTFFELQPGIRSTPGATPVPSPIRQGFQFEKVGFRYPGSERWAVRGLTFVLKPGERLALVGENGAGKTTLAKLLARLYDPTEGRILLDGRDLREYDIESLRRNVGLLGERTAYVVASEANVRRFHRRGLEPRIIAERVGRTANLATGRVLLVAVGG